MGKKIAKTQKYLFTLDEIDLRAINIKYSDSLGRTTNPMSSSVSYTDGDQEDGQVNTTKLVDLNTEKGTPEVVSFLDESKRIHTCHTSMIDFTSRMDISLLRYHCYWCKNPFNTKPVGCPVRYVASQAEKKYYSHISRDIYTIKENVTSRRRQLLDAKKADEIELRIGEYYETDGVFCSFNCCQAWINNNKHDRLYDHSTVLLMKMYNTIMGTTTIVINPAPHWRTLEQYGGHLNIIKFREGFNKVEYKSHGTTKSLPRFIPTGRLYEEHIRF